MKSFIVVLDFLLVATCAFATAQYPDKIIYKGKEYALHSNPLEEFFEKHPDKRPQGGITSTALWRGYVATFDVVDSLLYLKDIEIKVRDTASQKKYETKWKSVLKELFPDGQRLKVDWVSGILVLPYGEIVNYVHMGYGSTYEHYFLLEMDRGRLKKEKALDNKDYEAFKQRQFEAFKKTEEYKQMVQRLKTDEKYTDEFIEGFLRDYVISYSSKLLVD